MLDNTIAVGVIAWITIILVGIIKDFDLFKKIDKPLRKPIYLIIDCMFVVGLSAIYFAWFKIEFGKFIEFSLLALSSTLALYATYENTKLKDLIKIAKERLVKVIGKNVIEKQVQKQIEDNNNQQL